MAKKNWLGMLVVVLTFGMVVLSCFANSANSLANTKWECLLEVSSGFYDTRHGGALKDTRLYTLSFGINTCILDGASGTYRVSGESVVITWDNGETVTGTLAGNSLSLAGMHFSRTN
jgi:hypothetical protein